MKRDGYFSSGEFAKRAHVTKKTLRYYDENNILRPSFVTESGARFYTEHDFAKLQQILFLKYLSFSLADIKEMTLRNTDTDFLEESLKMQTALIEQKQEQLALMRSALESAQVSVSSGQAVDWSGMLELVNQNEMEEKLKKQYLNSSNIEARIRLHRDYAQNKQGWFPWVYEMCGLKPGEKVLELGCGDGSLWVQGLAYGDINSMKITLTDISDGMVKRAKENIINALKSGAEILGACEVRNDEVDFSFDVMDAHHIHAEADSFDVVIANHLLFYCEDLGQVLSEIKRVLKPGGRLICSTYSAFHMQEISWLVSQFDDRMVLSAEPLYEKFGKENGAQLLAEYFDEVTWQQYEDRLVVDKPEPLIAYILSCHGNQNRYIVDQYHDFYNFVKERTDRKFKITKDAGVFIARGI